MFSLYSIGHQGLKISMEQLTLILICRGHRFLNSLGAKPDVYTISVVIIVVVGAGSHLTNSNQLVQTQGKLRSFFSLLSYLTVCVSPL